MRVNFESSSIWQQQDDIRSHPLVFLSGQTLEECGVHGHLIISFTTPLSSVIAFDICSQIQPHVGRRRNIVVKATIPQSWQVGDGWTWSFILDQYNSVVHLFFSFLQEKVKCLL